MKRLFLALAAIAIAISGAMAADFDARIVNLDGSPILDEKGKEVEFTVRTAAVEALMASYPDEQAGDPRRQGGTELSGEEKLRRANLARSVQAKDTDRLTAEDIALIKRLINKRYPSPLVVEQAWRALEKK